MTLALALPLFATTAQAQQLSPLDELRALSEIDGDMTTLTADEMRKMEVLAQVLGLDPTAAPAAAAAQPALPQPALDAPVSSDT